MVDKHADVEALSFERAIEELETIVKRLEDGKVPLEELVSIYERGEALKRRCEHLLRQAEARVERSPSTPPASPRAPSRSTSNSAIAHSPQVGGCPCKAT